MFGIKVLEQNIRKHFSFPPVEFFSHECHVMRVHAPEFVLCVRFLICVLASGIRLVKMVH